MELNFTKMHGLGNDFVFVDDLNKSIELSADQVAFLCDRHFGIGADGVVLVRPSDRPECVAYMHYINSDGTLAEMCGNGVRCFTKYLVDHGYIDAGAGSYIADTKRGPLPISLKLDADGYMSVASVDMDMPILDPVKIPTHLPAAGIFSNGEHFVNEEVVSSPWGDFSFTCVSMGNPHAICFFDNLEELPAEWFTSSDKSLNSFDLNRFGSYFESHEIFPMKTNVEFIVSADDGLHMRVFERGCGETLACGTGACASLVAAVLTGRSARTNKVHLRGGTLNITWQDNNHVLMTGPATQVFTGIIEI